MPKIGQRPKKMRAPLFFRKKASLNRELQALKIEVERNQGVAGSKGAGPLIRLGKIKDELEARKNFTRIQRIKNFFKKEFI